MEDETFKRLKKWFYHDALNYYMNIDVSVDIDEALLKTGWTFIELAHEFNTRLGY